MFRHLALLLGALAASFSLLGAAPASSPYYRSYVGPDQILFADADSIYYLRSLDWHSKNARHQEKLLLTNLRMRYWRDHLPLDMRVVFDELGYPTGRVLLTPMGHTEEWWYYGQMQPPLRFRDGVLLDGDRFDRYRGR